MDQISVFDMLKIGVGPSSSHTLGPWRAAERFLEYINHKDVSSIEVDLYGSLALTGKGHGTDVAIILGLHGEDPVTITNEEVKSIPVEVEKTKKLRINNHEIPFSVAENIKFNPTIFLEEHANGLIFKAYSGEKLIVEKTFFSIGGGFIVERGETQDHSIFHEQRKPLPYPIEKAEELLEHCKKDNRSIAQVVFKNEKSWRKKDAIKKDLIHIWHVMLQCIYDGCHADGILPGGLNVKRRAHGIYESLKQTHWEYKTPQEWTSLIAEQRLDFTSIINWISCFSLAVNEENADFGKVVTAPTNGASGVIPAVLMYYICFSNQKVEQKQIENFLLVAGEIGSIFKKGATISAAMGGCQAEIGVSSAMAAAALTEGMGGSPAQATMAAEIAMEHHLGLTCDPIGGLVQIPCIERNSMGAIKAIMAANLAINSDPSTAKVSLDEVVETMFETAKDMNTKYKETSTGGLATKVAHALAEC